MESIIPILPIEIICYSRKETIHDQNIAAKISSLIITNLTDTSGSYKDDPEYGNELAMKYNSIDNRQTKITTLNPKKNICLYALHEKELVGILRCSIDEAKLDGVPNTIGIITRFHAAQLQQGVGIGTKLMNTLGELLVEQSISYIGIKPSNERVRKSIEKKGFVQGPNDPNDDEAIWYNILKKNR